MRHLALVAFFFPLLAFCLAGLIELRSEMSRMERLRNLIPIILGIAAFGLCLYPEALFELTPNSSVTLSRVMTMLSALIACSGVFISYSRRASAIWMAAGGLLLTLFWMFNRVLA
jgi:hypothetical protein